MNSDTRRVELAEYFQTLREDLLDRLSFHLQQAFSERLSDWSLYVT